jgi:hypothetical protein
MKKGVLFLIFVMLVISFANARIDITGDVIFDESRAGVSSVLLKITLTQGESLEKPINVFTDEEGEFYLEVKNLEGVSLDNNQFNLQSGESKEVFVKFDSSNLEPGIYIGKIEIRNGHGINELPISFEVETEDVFFDTNLDIPPAYSVLSSGGKFVAQVKLFDLTNSPGAKSVDVDYFIISSNGEIISWETEKVVVDEMAEFSKTIGFSEEVSDGNYFFGTVVNYGSSVTTASQFFSIKKDETTFSIFGKDFQFLAILIFILIIFAGFIFMFVYMIKDRDKLVLELKRYNSEELIAQRNLLVEQKKVLEEKGEDKAKLKKEIQEKIKSLRRKQKKRVGEFRKLKKVGSVSEMKRKLSSWKKSGYDTKSLEYKMEGLSAKEMQRAMKKWKGQGYKK